MGSPWGVQLDNGLSRRDFFKYSALAGAAVSISDLLALQPVHLMAAEAVTVNDPIASYPSRDWEKTYRNMFQDDDSFVFMCSPNDTHNCLLRAHTKNGVVVRISPTYGYGKAKDSYGNQASHRWDPRACQRGLMLARRFYGDRRVRTPMIRKGFKEWVDDGFPRDGDGEPRMDRTIRGEDEFLKISWEEAYEVAAKTYLNVAETYNGEEGQDLLTEQGYDEDMVEATHGAGVRVLKQRGGMPLLGTLRIFGMYRFSNSLALLDNYLRPDTEELTGGRQWDSYSWHTDLCPGHPMVTGHQTVDFELFAVENADLVVTWGMNWLCTKMPDVHWYTEAKLKGTKTINVTTDYHATSQQSDEVVMVRPGTDTALALGCAKYIIDEGMQDLDYIKKRTDLPLLVRMDDLTLLRAKDVFPGRPPAKLDNFVTIQGEGDVTPPPFRQGTQYIPEELRDKWDDFVVWDSAGAKAVAVTRDQIGELFDEVGVDPSLEGEFEVTVDGEKVMVRPVFDLVKKYLDDNFDLETTSEVTWASKESIISLAKQIAENPGKALLCVGMGPNHFFNADLKDRALFLLGAITNNVGHMTGNVGSYAGNYRGSVFNGVGQWIVEDPFNIEDDGTKPASIKKYFKSESAHYYNYGDRPLRVGNKNFTGETHMPTPTKMMHFAMSNSILGNAKWHNDVVQNTLPKVEAIFTHEWWWTASCEYADLVFGVDSWGELKLPDMTASCTNPFLQATPRTPMERLHDTKSDLEVLSGISKELASLTDDKRFDEYWQFVEDEPEVYLQRILDAGNATRGFEYKKLEADAKNGIPALMNYRTYPRAVGYEQVAEDRPWYNRTGRIETYRDEPEWIEYGENLPVFREPVDCTVYEPNVIHGEDNPAIQPAGPAEYDLEEDDLSAEVRQVRNVVKPWSDLKETQHPLAEKDDKFRFMFITPKHRWAAHTTQVDLDWTGMMFGPFGDIYRHDKRMPSSGEGYIDMNPDDAKKLDIEDGDYVYFDADPEDRPYRNWNKGEDYYEVARGLARARYHPGMQPGIARMWFNMYVATKGSVKGQKEREDGLARNPATGYQSYFRGGSHQSVTRAWLRPTLMTDTLTRKPGAGQSIGQGFESDVHCTNGAPKESFVRIEKAEDGAIDGDGLWRPAKEGLRATYESEAMKKFIKGDFIT